MGAWFPKAHQCFIKKKIEDLLDFHHYYGPEARVRMRPTFVRRAPALQRRLRFQLRGNIFSLARRMHSKEVLNLLRHEKAVQETVRKMHGEVFVDIGANIGFYSLILSKNFRRVVAVEPHPDNAREIVRNAKEMRVRNIEVVQKAVSRSTGIAHLYQSSRDSGHTLNPRSHIASKGTLPVETITLSELLKEYGQIDLVKVDVEGEEWGVLEGSLPIIDRIKAWVIELHRLNRKSELEKLLQGKGYSCRWLDYNHSFAER